ncbi:hypothetical protein PRZ48_009522 [Zasmidium cellare]|uniref:Monooxygenase n=1 Tax=Zasmidium cellare TaxID=395010 RepID=A0ABR0EBY1_ZASCE|nr:hypothetical protein PRZ48_009522 [Zasmidium cellare]
MAFEPIFNPFPTRPTPQALRHPTGAFLHLLRDNFSITTWLLFGALLQGLFCLLLPYPNIALILPALTYLLFKLLHYLLITTHILPDPIAKTVIPGRSVPVFPNPKTGLQDEAGGQGVTAILLASRANTFRGLFAPGFKEVGDYFSSFLAKMNSDPTRYGYLGSNTWMSANGDQSTGSETMGLIYFESEEKLYEFAHGPSHTEATRWFMRNGGKDFTHIGLMHEVFAAKRQGWEGVYFNYKPTGIGATTKEVEGKGWVSPLVKGNGKLRHSKGRMGRDFAEDEWADYNRMDGEDEKAKGGMGKE